MNNLDKVTHNHIQEVIAKHYSEILIELEDYIDTDSLELNISGKFNDALDGFEFKMIQTNTKNINQKEEVKNG